MEMSVQANTSYSAWYVMTDGGVQPWRNISFHFSLHAVLYRPPTWCLEVYCDLPLSGIVPGLSLHCWNCCVSPKIWIIYSELLLQVCVWGWLSVLYVFALSHDKLVTLSGSIFLSLPMISEDGHPSHSKTCKDKQVYPTDRQVEVNISTCNGHLFPLSKNTSHQTTMKDVQTASIWPVSYSRGFSKQPTHIVS